MALIDAANETKTAAVREPEPVSTPLATVVLSPNCSARFVPQHRTLEVLCSAQTCFSPTLMLVMGSKAENIM
jgi:hypothetical protein